MDNVKKKEMLGISLGYTNLILCWEDVIISTTMSKSKFNIRLKKAKNITL